MIDQFIQLANFWEDFQSKLNSIILDLRVANSCHLFDNGSHTRFGSLLRSIFADLDIETSGTCAEGAIGATAPAVGDGIVDQTGPSREHDA